MRAPRFSSQPMQSRARSARNAGTTGDSSVIGGIVTNTATSASPTPTHCICVGVSAARACGATGAGAVGAAR